MKVVNTNSTFSSNVWRPMSDVDKDGNAGDIFYQGQLLTNGSDGAGPTNPWPDGVSPAGPASGAADTTDELVLCGIVQGFDPRIRVLDGTYGVHSSTSVQTQATIAARNIGPYGGHEKYGDKANKLQMATITPFTPISIPIYNSSINTATTVLTATAVGAAGETVTTGNADFTPVANLATIYCRSGANEGIYRQTDDTSLTVAAWDKPMEKALAIGDTFVRVPCRLGPSWIQLDAEGIFMDGSATAGTDYYIFHVDEFHLEVAGQERIVGRFDPVHFGRRA